MSDVCVIINEATPDHRRKKTSSDVADSASNRHPTMATEEDDADDEDDDQDESDFDANFASRTSVATTSQALDLEGSIVVGGTAVRRRSSVCSSCGTCTSGSCDGSHDGESCASSRSTRGYSPTRESSGDDQDENNLPYPGYREVTMFYLKQTSHPRDWCLKMVNNPYPFGFLCI